ncbi:MAG TPA: hypothetical protein PKA06_08300 [Gemmatales bacterium]|nr:hypothetical protein [Gemmatales bacterium]
MLLRFSMLLVLLLILSETSRFALASETKPVARKKLYLIAGKKSHRYGEHSFRAGCILLKKRLDSAFPDTLETGQFYPAGCRRHLHLQ